jgi:hypothetical protein
MGEELPQSLNSDDFQTIRYLKTLFSMLTKFGNGGDIYYVVPILKTLIEEFESRISPSQSKSKFTIFAAHDT